ncbi:MAG: diiron oxygenase, partial [Acidobacteriales bacterium]|nr:diiron oxygenase [Terriglobales bacterium]
MSAELSDDLERLFLPPSVLPLFGTTEWTGMTDSERVAYSRAYCAAMFATCAWLEFVIIHFLNRMSVRQNSVAVRRYLLIEAAEECRHASAFLECSEWLNPDFEGPPRWCRMLGAVLMATGTDTDAMAAAFVAEELLDEINRRTADGEGHSVTRMISRRHVEDEARHLAFARAFLRKAECSRLSRFRTSVRVAVNAYVIARAIEADPVARSRVRMGSEFAAMLSCNLRASQRFLAAAGYDGVLSRAAWT